MTAYVAGSTAIDPDLVARFAAALERLNPDGGKLGLAVSGGPDSMAMLLLAQEAIPGGFEVATVDHGLRPEAKDECALVVAACEERGVPCAVLTVEVGDGNVQARAREARYLALGEWANERQIEYCATAHHLDDQIETFFMRLNRGSGLRGLAAIREADILPHAVDIITLIRPLLSFRHDELVAVCDAAKIEVASDPSNRDDSFDRVRMRNTLADSDWLKAKAIARSIGHIAEAENTLGLIEEHIAWRNLKSENGVVRYRPVDLPELNFRVLSKFVFGEESPVRGDAIAKLARGLQQGKSGNLGGVLATVEGNKWVFRPEPPRRTG